MRVILGVAAALLALGPLALDSVATSAASADPSSVAATTAVAAPAPGAAPTPRDPFDGITLTVADALFLADHSALPIIVKNSHTYQISVDVTAWADTARLDVSPTPVHIVVAPQTQGTVEIPATAVSNGPVTVGAAILTPNGTLAVTTAVTASFTVQAGWQTPVALVLLAIVVALAVLGVIRTVRRVRRRRTNAELT